MKRQLLIITCTAVALGAVGRLLPADGQKQWRWSIDAAMPEDYAEGELIDLSDATIAKAYETHYSVYGDTLVCRTFPDMRDWFVLRDGSLWTVGANDRVSRHAYSRGLMYLPSGPTPEVHTTADTLTVSAVDSDPVKVSVHSTLRMSAGPGFILALGDTVFRTTEVSVQSVRIFADGASVTCTDRRWYADGCLFPVVEETGISSGGNRHATLTVCPPSEQPSGGVPESRGDGPFGAPPLRQPGGEVCTDIVRQGDTVTAGNVPGDGGVTVSVCDIQGRVIRTGTGDVSIAGLPPGWYIITASAASGDTSVKFRID